MAKILSLYPGKGVVRQYKNAKKVLKLSAGTGLIEFGLAADLANSQKLLSTSVIALCMFRMISNAEKAYKVMYNLKPKYDEIVTRRNKIFKKS